jgi:His Kinase A (phospho-acceptor) domain
MAKRKNDAGAAGPCRHAARLDTMANLARPVQHEINNLLTVIFANLEMLKRTAAEGAPQRQLDRIAEAARRFEASTRSILSLSRRSVPGFGEVKLPEALTQLRPLLLVLMPAPGLLSLELEEEEGWPALLDRAALDEALIALAREAAGVLPRGGSLALAAANLPGPPDLVELSIRWPAEVALPSLAALRGLAEAAGGRVEEAAEGATLLLRLLLPRHTGAG